MAISGCSSAEQRPRAAASGGWVSAVGGAPVASGGTGTSGGGLASWAGGGGVGAFGEQADRGGAAGMATELAGAPSTELGGAGGDVAEPPVDAGVPGIIAVGYGGLRLVSRDLGKTWTNETHWSTNGGDDEDLLRTIAYGNGVWLSAGWRLVTSIDGVTWTDHGRADAVITAVNCKVTDGLAFGAGKFLVACGSNLAESSDGLNWRKVGPTPAVGGHPYLIWNDAERQFVCAGDDGPSFTSSDGKAWTKIAISKAHLCEGGLAPKSTCASFYTQGVFLTTEWGGVIRRSTNGTSFEKTYQDRFENNLFTEYAFGVGRVAP